jgi:hypothetical protein
MKTLILTLLLNILIMSCTKQNPTTKQTTKGTANVVTEDYTIPYFLRNKFYYQKDLNTLFIKLSKSKGQGC